MATVSLQTFYNLAHDNLKDHEFVVGYVCVDSKTNRCASYVIEKHGSSLILTSSSDGLNRLREHINYLLGHQQPGRHPCHYGKPLWIQKFLKVSEDGIPYLGKTSI